eukprot:scaffold4538_cov410-Prasinococcus_capsulatus_cf.AAC.1
MIGCRCQHSKGGPGKDDIYKCTSRLPSYAPCSTNRQYNSAMQTKWHHIQKACQNGEAQPYPTLLPTING